MLRLLIAMLLCASLVACGTSKKSQPLTGKIEVIFTTATTARCGAIAAETVTVRNESDAIIATGKTDKGAVSTDPKILSCDAGFSVTLPAAKFYQFQIAGYQSKPYSYDELKQAGWYVLLLWT